MAYVAITAEVSHEITNSGAYILVTDDTTYRTGGDTPTRANCLVNFLIEHIVDGVAEDITPNYVAASVTSVLVPISEDGWYRITMTVTNAPAFGTTFSTQAVQNILVTDRFCACWTAAAYLVYTTSTCNCESIAKINKLAVLDAQFEGVENMVSRNDMQSAANALERLGYDCATLSDSCGCGCG